MWAIPTTTPWWKPSTAYKAVVLHRRGLWCSCEAVEFGTLEWVDWIIGPIGNIAPNEAEEHDYAMLTKQPMAA